MGIASQDLDGDGKPEVFLSNQGDNKLQTLVKDATGPNYHSVAIEAGVTAHEPFTGGDTGQSTAWHSEFADVNNDAFMDLFIAKGNIEAMPEYAAKDPSNLLIGQPGRRSSRAGRRPGSSTSRRVAGRRSSTSTLTACSTWSRWSGARTSSSGATSAPGRDERRRRSATGRRSGSARPARTATRSAPG